MLDGEADSFAFAAGSLLTSLAWASSEDGKARSRTIARLRADFERAVKRLSFGLNRNTHPRK
jgi:hypothetical protein